MTQHFDWRTDTIRFSFLGCTDEAAESITWESLTGLEPESITNKKSLQTRNEEGPWGPGYLTVAAQSGRVDVILLPIQPQNMPKEPPHLGSLPVVASLLRACILGLKLPKCSRLAIGAQISLVVDDSAAAIDCLNKLSPCSNFKSSLKDVVFQYNEPKKLKHSGIEFNRLYKWMQARVQFVQFAIGAEGMPLGTGADLNTQHVLQLELDFNTAHGAPLPHLGAQEAIIKEMFDILISDGYPQAKL